MTLPSKHLLPPPAIEVVKFVENLDANVSPGPGLTVGESVTWTYQVTNTGNVDFNSVVAEGQYMNSAEATGTATWGSYASTASDDDPANHFGASADITIVKRVNGHDANEIPGISITPGSAANFTYEVTNSGNTHLIEVLVEDDQGVALACPKTVLAPSETMTCTGSATALPGPYRSVATGVGTPAALDTSNQAVALTDASGSPLDDVTDDDPANYHGTLASIDIVKYINGNDANTYPGIMLPSQSAANWTYVVHNTGNTPLINVGITDDQGLSVTCPATEMEAGSSMTCVASGTVSLGDYRNVGLAVGMPAAPNSNGILVPLVDSNGDQLQQVSDDDTANNFGYKTGVSIITRVFGFDAPVNEAVHAAAGGSAPHTFEVANTGNTWLEDLVVTDSDGTAITCPAQVLAPGASMTCTSTGEVTVGTSRNIGSVVGTPTIQSPNGLEPVLDSSTGQPIPKPTDDDDANVFGENPALELDKSACYNGKCGNGLSVPNDGLITWVITVRNIGNVALTQVTVTDNIVKACGRSIGTLAPGETTTIECEAEASVALKNHANVVGNTVSQVPTGSTETIPTIQTKLTADDTAFVTKRSGGLAHTGTNIGFMFAIGFWMSVLGSALLWSTRRQRLAA